MGESAHQDALDGAAGSGVDGAYAYFELTADLRKCASPLCGGWFVKRLNQSTTVCHDGREAAACYTPVLDWSEANLPDAEQARLLDGADQAAVSSGVYAIVRGRFAPANTTPRPELGRFVISEAWVAESDAVAEGTFVRVEDNGRRCVVAPCENLTETTLDTPRSAVIAKVDWTPAGLSDGQIRTFNRELFTPGGVLVAGYRYTVHEQGRTANGRTATAVYHRLSGSAPPP